MECKSDYSYYGLKGDWPFPIDSACVDRDADFAMPGGVSQASSSSHFTEFDVLGASDYSYYDLNTHALTLQGKVYSTFRVSANGDLQPSAATTPLNNKQSTIG